ncbi:MAG: electron transfer flavoprotein subunit alpha/FixB family protein [Acidimicrobiaceae bacterium]|nr:electron transfer flavoprotein subunit alpha/FixB family protein [Acidimicrobiaceae bacterium]MYD08129.1 electron transfer flavoprotein subunit alpha/FixB family protein [Acidimicrobiaceae bacterium]MYI60036.1 electron transfer flavoprotein subunit alpha/FixB family protein [Acidimicrobiaceae bacterium]
MLLVVLEHDRGALAEAAREALTFGRSLAEKMDEDLEAALIGADDDALVTEAGNYGAEVVHTCVHEVLSDYGPDAYGAAVAQMVTDLEPSAVLACGSDRGNEVMAQVAARLDAPFVANCVDVTPGIPWTMTRVQWGGSLLEDSSLDADVALLTCGLHAVAAQPGDSVDAHTETFDADLDESHRVTVVKDRTVLQAGVTLPTAPVVCGGGRGVGSAEGFAQLEELAGLLGGRVGCSRAVTNLGWRPHSDQVGQTGTRIAPEIYIASGISGAIQHWVGAMASKHILAINTDREANMVVKADWAVIADLHEVIPAITAEIRSRKG